MLFCTSTERTRLSPLWPWGSSARTKSPLLSSRLRTGVTLTHLYIPNIFIPYWNSTVIAPPSFGFSLCLVPFIFSPLPFFRYIYYFGGLLSGSIKMNSSPLFLHQILIPSLPNFQTGGGQFCKNSSRTSLAYCNGNPQFRIVRRKRFHQVIENRQWSLWAICIQMFSPFNSLFPSYLLRVSAGFYPFVKIYQSLQLVYTSGV